jgi:peptidyl-prolyl cis-trans isomerase D
MATLQRIRNNAGTLVLIFVGVALLSFIVGDFFKADQRMLGKSRNEVAEIEGKSIPIQYFQEKIDENTEMYKRNTGKTSLDNQTIDQLQDQTWEDLIRENLINQEFAEIGLQVTEDELFDMVQGNNIDPQLKQIPIFQNQQTGQFDRNLVIQFLKNKEMDPNAVASWNSFEKSLVQNKLNEKYYAIVGKGMYVTSLQAKQESVSKNTKYDFDYIQIRYNTLSDSSITITDSELKAYFKKNESKFEQEESREIYYVSFPVVPSADDHAQTLKWAESLKQEFTTSPAVEQFVNLNSDAPFNPVHLTQEELPASIALLFASNEGTVIGPFEEEGIVKIARLTESVNISDSVKARHILIRPNEKLSKEAAKVKADSILSAIKKGSNFAELAKKFSQDATAEKGGDLGWFKENVYVQLPSLNNLFFKGKKGNLEIVETPAGYHIVEILEQSKPVKKVQVAILERAVTASTKTVDNTYSVASKFGSSNRDVESFKNSANLENLSLKTANVKRNDRRLATFENPRAIIRWAFKADQGAVSEIFELENQYVIASVKTVREKGIPSFDEVKADVEREVRNEKKAESLISKLNEASAGASTLQIIADKVLGQVKEATNVTFAAYSIPGLGFEPELEANLTSLAAQQISKPIKGKAGVYVIQIKNVLNPGTEANYMREKDQMMRAAQTRVSYQVFNAIRDASEITDNRSNFY